jgi:hypothetical protein
VDFRTELTIKPSPIQIGLKEGILTLGSCFAETMGRKFSENKFHVCVNPFGTTYHPLAIHKLLNYVVFQEYPQAHTYIVSQDAHLNYDFHSRFRSTSLNKLQENINATIATTHFFLKQCSTVIITYGTAWVYEREDTGEAVANCHKMPGKLFSKRLSKSGEIIVSFNEMLKNLRSINPNVRLLLSVSPVRHIKDTLALNNLSKSVLRVACHELTATHSGIEYFPAYEIMVDDLRDYRFYKEDLIHPIPMAEDYIWDKFNAAFFSKSTADFIDKFTGIKKALAHRPFDAGSSSHKKFLTDLLAQLEALRQHADLVSEIEDVRSQIAAIG